MGQPSARPRRWCACVSRLSFTVTRDAKRGQTPFSPTAAGSDIGASRGGKGVCPLFELKIEKAPDIRSPFVEFFALLKGSDGTYVLGLQPLGTLLHLELHLRAFIQRTVAVRLNSRKMHEHVIAGGSLDESKSLRGVKPLNYTFFFLLQSPDALFVKPLAEP